MIGLDVVVRGADQLARKLHQIEQQTPRAIGRALYREGTRIISHAKRDFVPVDDGHLRQSGRTELPKQTAQGIAVQLSFGGPAAPYALAIHEHPSQASPPQWRGKSVSEIRSVRERRPWTADPSGGRGPKFLERPLKLAAEGMGDRLAKAIREVIG